jgi:hypothetical protein
MLTPGTTLHFSSLGYVYTGPVEPLAGCTFGWPPRSNVLSGPAAREAFVRSYSGDVIIGMLGPNPTQERFRSPPNTSPTSPSRTAEMNRWAGGSSWSGTPQCTPVDSPASRTTR